MHETAVISTEAPSRNTLLHREGKEEWIEGPQKTQFYTRTYYDTLRPKVIIVFVHGFLEHIARKRYEELFASMCTRGIAVFAYDQRGFGRTALGGPESQDRAGGGKDTRVNTYGRSSWDQHIDDIAWAVGCARRVIAYPEDETDNDIPVVLYGHSMGGGLVLAFATQPASSPHRHIISSLAGIISSSPLIVQAEPFPVLMRWIVRKLATLAPDFTIPLKVESQNLSHNPAANKEFMMDPPIKKIGSLRGLSTMLDGAEQLVEDGYKHWPSDLPVTDVHEPSIKVLLAHGTADKVTSFHATKAFYEKIEAKDKTFSSYDAGFHDLHNEPNGVKETIFEEFVKWMETRAGTSLSPSNMGSST
ncbi:alpha beta-hydrolase [Hygrophoropsis aurantiaca]|uniref:Alpha beta-hydrolase n=1 Tax=Hygrophoropsis aurantiaca TaxID=72124 RepID=A0ACB7ZUY0_9AGAM|nr:alpha beta-hydrolase [Hygrophoropsis aurantiaca]